MAWPYGSANATIANGASLSDAVDLGGKLLGGILMPAAWTAANLTFQASADGVTYGNVYDAVGDEYTVTAAASRFIALDPSMFSGAQYVKVRSGTAGSPVNQGAARVIVLSSRDIT